MAREEVFRERLRGLRASKGLTQKRVANALGISDVGYRYYETGVRRPTFEILPLIADFFNVSTDYLLGRVDEPRMLDKDTLRIARDIQAINARMQKEQAQEGQA